MQVQSAKTFTYRRHEPETKLLYQVLAREWETWSAERRVDSDRTHLPSFVEREMEAYFRCGILDHGFSILSMTWARLLTRVFAIDISVCHVCGSRVRPESVEVVDDPVVVVVRILLALGLYGCAPARAPPRSRGLFDDMDQSAEEAD